MQALDEDQEGPIVQHRKLFEEDREFNQGAAHVFGTDCAALVRTGVCKLFKGALAAARDMRVCVV